MNIFQLTNRYFFVFISLLTCFYSCDKDDDYSHKYTISNTTNFDLRFESIVNDDILLLDKNETKTFKSNTMAQLFKIIPTPNSPLVFDVKESSSNNFTVYTYDYQIKYSITGTAERAMATYNNSNGETLHYTSNIPFEIGIKRFLDSFFYISAQNQDEDGSVTVTIYYKGQQIKTSTCTAAFCIATAHN